MGTELLSSTEMADRLGVTPDRVTQMARERGIGEQVGGIWVFSPEDEKKLKRRPSGRPKSSEQ